MSYTVSLNINQIDLANRSNLTGDEYRLWLFAVRWGQSMNPGANLPSFQTIARCLNMDVQVVKDGFERLYETGVYQHPALKPRARMLRVG